MSASPADPSLRAAVTRLRARELSPPELLDACLARIQTTRELGAFVAVDADRARREARAHQPSPLNGIPLAVKDIVDVAGMQTRAGSPALHDAPPARADAAIVSGLRARGAIPVGKAATHELAAGVTTPAVRNPRDPDATAGGSSGGSAAAVAAGAVPLALGTDTAGSVRIPAACCGVCGLIERNGRLPTLGVMPLSQSLDTLGVLVREPGDLALAWHSLSGRSPEARALSTVLVLAEHSLGPVEDGERAAAAAVVERLAVAVRELDVDPLRDWAPPRAIVILDEALHARFTAPINAARLACAVVPVDGVGVQIAAVDEETVLAAVARLAD